MRGPWAAQGAQPGDDLEGWGGVREGGPEGGDACTDLNYHTAKANTTL